MRSGAGWARAGEPAEAASIRRIMSDHCSRLCGCHRPVMRRLQLHRPRRRSRTRVSSLCATGKFMRGMRMANLVLRGGRIIDPASGRDLRSRARSRSRGRKLPMPGEDRVGRWIDERIDRRTSTPRSGRMPRRLTSSMSRCSVTRREAGISLSGIDFTGPNHSAVQTFRFIGTRAGLRPKIPKLVFDTTFRSWRPADARLFG